MRYIFFSFIILLLSCERTNSQRSSTKTQVIPVVDVIADTVNNGEILSFKGYLRFEPSVNSFEESKLFVNNFELRFDSTASLDLFKHKTFALTERKGDTSYGEFLISYSNTDSLPNYFEHFWNISFLVNFPTETGKSVDTTYTQALKVIVTK